MKPLVIYHADCTDGFGAAFAAWKKFGGNADYVPAWYNDRNIMNLLGGWMIAEREVYILDFSFPRDIMDHLFANAKRVVWLDHHKTAFEMWCGKYEPGMQHVEGDNILLDDTKSGALLAWEWFHGTEVPQLIRHIDDRDRWQFKMQGSKEIHAALASYKPWSFTQWNDWTVGMFSVTGEELMDQGAAILRAQDQHVADMVKQARGCEIRYDVNAEVTDRFTGLAVNTPMHISEVGHELANKSGTFGLVWYLGNDGRAKCSLRSNGGYDVSAIARSFGGGGHRNAAGFETGINTLLTWLK